MQNAYDSYQVTQLIGRFSWLPAAAVHVYVIGAMSPSRGDPHCRLAVVGSMCVVLFQPTASHPVSYPPLLPLFERP
jgi:hypothetical protein